MIVLAVESSGGTCGATVCETTADRLMQMRATAELFTTNTHDKQLALVVKQALDSSGLTIDNIDCVAVSAGPGSFTGLRIGMSLCKGLTYSNSPRLLLIDTLSALAQASKEVAQIAGSSHITSVIPSHRNQFYAQRYLVEDEGVTVDADHDISALMEPESLREFAKNSLICGPGASSITDAPISGLTRLSSRFIGLRACTLISSGQAVYTPSERAQPLYQQEFKGNRP